MTDPRGDQTDETLREEAARVEDAQSGTEQAAASAAAGESTAQIDPDEAAGDGAEPVPPDEGGAPAEGEAAPEGPRSAGDLHAIVEDLRTALGEAERARDEYLDFLRRERAEFENFRKRANRERMQALDRGAEQLVGNLLGVMDNLTFALDAAEGSEDDRLAKGVQMVSNELLSVLEAVGLQEVKEVGVPFDPAMHEVMMQVEAEEPVDEPVVVEVLRRGYRFKDRVLRPASVKVAK